MQFKNTVIFYHSSKNAPLAEQVSAFVRARGVAAQLAPDADSLHSLSPTDLLICLGGDGATLRAARLAAPLQIPIFSINCGTLGFLSGCEAAEFEPSLEDVLAGRCSIQERALLNVDIVQQGHVTEAGSLAFNDCVLRAAQPRALTIEAWADGRPLQTYFADGVILATPTGSTAYSLAAGGPIVAPGVDVLLLTPICPHSLTQRPLILPGSTKLCLRPLIKTELGNAVASLDGQQHFTLSAGDEIRLQKSLHPARLVYTPRRDFFTVLSSKLKWGKRSC